MKKEVKISNNYISVMYNGIQSYGGSQLWFDGNMRRCGCGVIAAADVLLYLKQRTFEAAAKDNVPAKCMLSDAYIKYVEKLRPAFPLIPGRGMPCFMLALYLKIYMRVTKLPYRVGFGARRLKSCICDMLTHDVPVILCIGPGVHQFMKSKSERGIMLYSRSETVCCRPSSVYMSPDDASDDIAFVSGSSGETDTVSRRRNADAAYASADNPGRLSYFTYTPVRRVRSHFVTVTALEGDYALVSSWGKPYYISVTELARYSKLDMFGLFTNVVRIHDRLFRPNYD